MKRFATCLWFKDQAEEAARFYVSIFRNSRIKAIARYGPAGAKVSGRPLGSVMTVSFRLNGQDFVALNGGPVFKLTEAVSIMVPCKTQREIDHYWKLLTRGGRPSVCGWLKDRYGMSWQIVPDFIEKAEADKDPVKANRLMAAILRMTKLDLAKLKKAYAG